MMKDVSTREKLALTVAALDADEAGDGVRGRGPHRA
jgi:hypothetical protein